MLLFHSRHLFLNVPECIQTAASQIAIYSFTKGKMIYVAWVISTDYIYSLSLVYLLGGGQLILKQHKHNPPKINKTMT